MDHLLGGLRVAGVTDLDYSPKFRTVRQSTLGDIDICLRRAQANVAGLLKRKESQYAMQGTAYHVGLESYYLARQRKGRYFEPSTTEVLGYCKAAEEAFENIVLDAGADDREVVLKDSIDVCLDQVTAMVLAYFADGFYWPENFQVVDVEWRFNHPFTDTWRMSGTADLVLFNRDTGKLILDDHKTAGKMWPERKADPMRHPQPAWYVKAAQVEFPEMNGYEFFFSVMRRDAQKFRRYPATPSQAHIDALTERAEQSAALFDLGTPLPTNTTSFLCTQEFCDFWDRCPSGGAT